MMNLLILQMRESGKLRINKFVECINRGYLNMLFLQRFALPLFSRLRFFRCSYASLAAKNETRSLGASLPVAGSETNKRLAISFVCKSCNCRSHHFMSHHAYTKGLVIIQCPHCPSRHLIADNLGWLEPTSPAGITSNIS